MRNKIIKFFPFIFSLILWINPLQGQVLDPATWSHELSKQSVSQGDTLELIFRAEIQDGWYLYSSDFDPDLGPMVTTFTFDENEAIDFIGDIRPINPREAYDSIFEGNYTYFKQTGEFRQTIKVIGENPGNITGSYSYQVCSDETGKCIPFDEEFSFSGLRAGAEGKSSGQNFNVKKPTEKGKDVSGSEAENEQPGVALPNQENGSAGSEKAVPEKDNSSTIKSGGVDARGSTNTLYSLSTFFIVAFLAGLAALLTPCVFPMIPMTVSFFTNQSKTRGAAIIKAFFYGVSIIAIYTLLGTIFSKIFGPAFANWLSTHWLPNIIFFGVFVFFALAFFGLFELNLPSSVVNKVDKQSDKGGYYGIFFMAFTLVLVSFSCTGPIVGSILVESARGAAVKPVIGMLGFSLAFAIPFTVFAIFPEWVNKLPKSGGWLNTVKVVLGFVELALAMKFLSIADQVYHWGILDREIYLSIWIAILAFLGFYLLGKIRLPGDSEVSTISVPRMLMSLVVFTFVIYLVPGLFGAPLKALAGYLPPMSTHDFDLPGITRQINESSDESPEKGICDEPKYADFLHLPHGINGYFDYEQALACARKQNKPIFLDFTGHGCVNCREMEARVWSDPRVLEKLKEDFVVVSLYVDEKKVLPESEWYRSSYDGKIKKTIGKQNADLQITKFNNNAQPFYVLLNNQGELLKEPLGYENDVQEFADFLEEGKERFARGETLKSQDPLARK